MLNILHANSSHCFHKEIFYLNVRILRCDIEFNVVIL